MKKNIINFLLIVFLIGLSSFNKNKAPLGGTVYKCTTCCLVKIGDGNNTPWESGCKSSSGMHNFVFAAHAGSKVYYCSKCKIEVSVKQDEGVSASASRCCSDCGLCNWNNK